MREHTFTFLRELAAGETVSVRVAGECMEPLVRAGTTVTVRQRALYLPGDVVVFRTRAGDLAVHRVLGYRMRALVTKGDRCDFHDAPVARDAIVGAVVGIDVSIGARLAAFAELARIIARRVMR